MKTTYKVMEKLISSNVCPFCLSILRGQETLVIELEKDEYHPLSKEGKICFNNSYGAHLSCPKHGIVSGDVLDMNGRDISLMMVADKLGWKIL